MSIAEARRIRLDSKKLIRDVGLFLVGVTEPNHSLVLEYFNLPAHLLCRASRFIAANRQGVGYTEAKLVGVNIAPALEYAPYSMRTKLEMVQQLTHNVDWELRNVIGRLLMCCVLTRDDAEWLANDYLRPRTREEINRDDFDLLEQLEMNTVMSEGAYNYLLARGYALNPWLNHSYGDCTLDSNTSFLNTAPLPSLVDRPKALINRRTLAHYAMNSPTPLSVLVAHAKAIGENPSKMFWFHYMRNDQMTPQVLLDNVDLVSQVPDLMQDLEPFTLDVATYEELKRVFPDAVENIMPTIAPVEWWDANPNLAATPVGRIRRMLSRRATYEEILEALPNRSEHNFIVLYGEYDRLYKHCITRVVRDAFYHWRGLTAKPGARDYHELSMLINAGAGAGT